MRDIYFKWIIITIIVSLVILVSCLLLGININDTLSSIFISIFGSLVVGLFLLFIDRTKRVNITRLSYKILFLEGVRSQLSFIDTDYYNDPEYPYYDDYYLKHEGYIKMLNNNKSLVQKYLIDTYDLEEVENRKIIKNLRKKNSVSEDYIANIFNKIQLLCDELKDRKKVFYKTTNCEEEDLFDDPFFLYNMDKEYNKLGGYDKDRDIFRSADKIINKLHQILIDAIELYRYELEVVYKKYI